MDEMYSPARKVLVLWGEGNMSTSNRVFLAAIILGIVATVYMPPLPPDTQTIGEWTIFHLTPPIDEYLSLPLALLMCSVGLIIAGIKLRGR